MTPGTCAVPVSVAAAMNERNPNAEPNGRAVSAKGGLTVAACRVGS